MKSEELLRLLWHESDGLEQYIDNFAKESEWAPRELNALLNNGDFMSEIRLLITEFDADCERQKTRLSKSDTLKRYREVREVARNLLNSLPDVWTTREAYKETVFRRLKKAGKIRFFGPLANTPSRLDPYMLFECLTDFIKDMETAIQLLDNESFSHKDYASIKLARGIGDLLKEYGVKTKIYDRGIWAFLLGIALACSGNNLSRERVKNILRAAKDIVPGKYGSARIRIV